MMPDDTTKEDSNPNLKMIYAKVGEMSSDIIWLKDGLDKLDKRISGVDKKVWGLLVSFILFVLGIVIKLLIEV